MNTNFYNNSDYFDKNKKVFLDRNSKFQKYRIEAILKLHIPKHNEKIVDLGCGWGTFSFTFARYGAQVTGVDISQKSIEICTEEQKRLYYSNIQFLCKNARQTGLPPNSQDTVVAADLVEHIDDNDTFFMFKECNRILKKGGKLVIWTPNRGHILEILKNNNIILKRDVSHIDYKNLKRLINYCKSNGFNVIKYGYYHSHLPILNIFERIFQKFIPILRRRIYLVAIKEADVA